MEEMFWGKRIYSFKLNSLGKTQKFISSPEELIHGVLSLFRQLVPDFVRMEWVEKIERRRLTEQQLFELTPKELKNMLSTDGDKVNSDYSQLLFRVCFFFGIIENDCYKVKFFSLLCNQLFRVCLKVFS